MGVSGNRSIGGAVRCCLAFSALKILLLSLYRASSAAAWTLGHRSAIRAFPLRRMSVVKEENGVMSADLARRVAGISSVLDKLYPHPPVPLNHRDDFTFLCAVVLCECRARMCVCV